MIQKTRWYIITLLLGLVLAVAGCGGQQAEVPAAQESVAEAIGAETEVLPLNLDVSTVESLRQNDDVVVLDVREDWEYNEGHIPGAKLVPLGQIPNRLDEIPQDKTVIAVCRSGNRSGQATNFLREQGFENVHNMVGGMNAWRGAGYDVE
jgi:rhodanese-related sulfurtransferase